MKKIIILLFSMFLLLVMIKPSYAYIECACDTCDTRNCLCPESCPNDNAGCQPETSHCCGTGGYSCATYYAMSKANNCGFLSTTTLGCGSGTSNYCGVATFYADAACGSSSPFSCASATRTASCGDNTVCGKCAGGADTCGTATCGDIYGCSPSPKVCTGQGTGAGNCATPDNGATCYCDAMCTGGYTCVSNTCTAPTNAVNLYLNGTQNSNKAYTYPQAINATGTSQSGTVYIYRDNVLVASGSSPQSEQILLGNATYTYKVNATNNATGLTFYAYVNKGTPSLSCSGTGATYPSSISFSGSSCPTQGASDVTCSLTNPTPAGCPSCSGSGCSILCIGGTTYSSTYATSGGTNWSSYTSGSCSATQNKGTLTGTLTCSGSGCWGSVTYGTSITIGYSESNSGDADFTYKVYRDGVDKGSGETWTPGVTSYSYKLNTTAGSFQNYSSSSSLNTNTLIVSQASSAIYLFINGSRTNSTFNQNSFANYTSQLVTPSSGNVELWTNYSDNVYKQWTAASSPLVNLTNMTVLGVCRWTANYTGNQNYSSSTETWYVTVRENNPPTYSSNQTNTTGAGMPANFTLLWNDDSQLAGYIFSTNNSGSWKNSSYVSFSGTNTSWNVTTLNSTVGALVQWCFYANDTFGNMNSTSCSNPFNLTTSDLTPPFITIQSPTNTTYTSASVWANVTLNEAGSWCGVNNDTNSVNITMTNSSGNWNYNFTGLSQGSHNFRFYCNDTSGNMNTSIVYFSVDTIPPTYSNNITNDTTAGKPVQFSLQWNDTFALHNAGQYQAWLDNCTGTFVNVTSLTNFTSTPQWANFTVVINNTVGCTIKWFENASDNISNWNNTLSSSNYFSFTTISDYPQYSSNSTNGSCAGCSIEHELKWTDNYGLSGYIFSFINGTNGTAIYNFSDVTNNQAWNNSVAIKPPTNLTNASETVFSSGAYTNISVPNDNAYFITNSSAYPYQKFNITINDSINTITQINISWEGYTLSGQTVNLYAYNFTSGSWGSPLTSGTGTSDFWLNKTITSGFSDLIQNGRMSILVQDPLTESSDADKVLAWSADNCIGFCSYIGHSNPFSFVKGINKISAQTSISAISNIKNNEIEIVSASVIPSDVKPGNSMMITVDAKAAAGIKSITAAIEDIETVELQHVSGTVYQGTWQRSWLVHDTEAREYNITLKITDNSGNELIDSSLSFTDSPGNIICGTGSIGTCPTTGSECSGNSGVCNYPNCTCVVASQSIDSNGTYTFANLTIPSGVTLTISTQALGGDVGAAGANGPGTANGGSGGAGGNTGASGGSYAGGGGGGKSGCPYQGGTGGSYSGGGGGGGNYNLCGYGPSVGGGAGGGRFNVNASNITIKGTINAVGGTVNCGTTYCASGGGGGGGNVILWGNSVNISGGTVNAYGGNSGSGWITGGGGGGGYVQIRYNCSYTAGTYSVSGGTAATSGYGPGSANGANGNTGSTSAAVGGGILANNNSCSQNCECISNSCNSDYNTSAGKLCCGSTQCAHNSTCYNNGQTSGGYTCNSGTWSDSLSPTYSLNSTNSTAGASILHSLNWSDNIGLSGYIFQFCNGTWNGTSCGLSSAPSPNWADANCNYRRLLSFNKPFGTENLANFPALLVLNSIGINYTSTSSTDIRFYDSDNSTLLYKETELWNTSGNSYVWVKKPSLNNNTQDYIWAYYNCSNSNNDNRTQVWDSNYVSVLHLNESSGTIFDSTSFKNNASVISGAAYNANAKIGAGYNEYTSESQIDINHSSNLNTPDNITVEMWLRPNGNQLAYTRISEKIYSTSWYFGTTSSSGLGLEVFINGASRVVAASPVMVSGQWSFIAFAWDKNYPKIYVDGKLNATGAQYTAAMTGDTRNVTFGRYKDGNGYSVNATYDEIRISNTTRSASWLNASYLTESDQLITYGSEQGITTSTSLWANDTWVSMAGTTNWSNVTKTVNSTVNAWIAWCFYANDTSNNWNSSCSNPYTYNTMVSFSTVSTDYIEVKVNSGWVNDTWTNTSFSGTTSWSNVTKIVNSIVGRTIFWKVYANDTNNNWNVSQEYSYLTTSPIQSYNQSIIQSLLASFLTSRMSLLGRSITSSMVTSLVLSRLSSFYRFLSSSVIASQIVQRVASIYRSITSYFTVSQYQTRLGALFESLSQSITFNVIFARILGSFRILSSSLTISQYITNPLSSLRSVASSSLISSATSRLPLFVRSITSYFTANQIATRMSSLYRSIATSSTFSDALYRASTLYASLPQSLSISQLSSRLSDIYRSLTGYFAFSSSLAKASSFYQTIMSSITSNTLVSRVSSLFNSVSNSISISQYISRLPFLYRSLASYFSFSQSMSKMYSSLREASSSITANAISSRMSTVFRSITSYMSLSQSLSRISSFLMFLLQLLGINTSPINVLSTYNLAITNPTTSSPIIVDSNQNITITFNFTNLTGQPISSGVNVTSILIGSNPCSIDTILGTQYNPADSLWKVNCTVPADSGVQDLYLQANYTTNNILRDNIQVYAIQYSGFQLRFITLSLTIGQSLQRIAGLQKSVSSFFLFIQTTSRVESLLRTTSQLLSIEQISSRASLMYTSLSQSYSFNQVIARFSTSMRYVSSFFTTDTAITRANAFLRILTSGFSIFNNLGNILATYNRYIAGNLIMSGSITRLSSLNRIIGDMFSMNLIFVRFNTMSRGIVTSFSFVDSFSRIATLSRTLTGGLTLSSVVSRTQFITYMFYQQFTAIANALGFNPGALNYATTTLSLAFSSSIQRTAMLSRMLSETLSVSAVFTRTLSLIRIFTDFFGISTRNYGVIPLICSIQSTESNCAFIGGCYWCSGTCQASTCTQPSIPSGGGWIMPRNLTNVTEEKVAFDVDVNIENEQVVPGGKVYATVSLLKYSGPKTTTDVNLTYWIENPEGKIVGMKESVIGVEALRRNMYFLTIPIDSELGLYTFKTIGRYDNFTTVASATFNVVSSLPEFPIISNISVPKTFENIPFNISLSLNNKIDRQLEVNVSLILPSIFEPSTIARNVKLGPLSIYTIDFETKSNETGTFTGFIKIEYNNTKVVKDFPIVIYSNENVFVLFARSYWWMLLFLALILVILTLYVIRLGRELNKIEKRQARDEEAKIKEIQPEELEKLEAELRETEEFRESIEEEFREGLISKESYDDLKREYEKRISELNEEIERNKKILKGISEKQ